MDYTVYILKSIPVGSYYIGQTNNLERRLNDHNRGKDHSSKLGMPWELAYEKRFASRSDAVKYEKHLKSLKSRGAIEKLIAG